MLRHREFEASELSLSSYVLSLLNDAPFIAIPVFPSRMFRHSGIYVNSSAGIDSPADLVGKIVGVPEYQMTAGVWIRGILAEYYGVPIGSVHYRTGGLEQVGRVEKLDLDLPGALDVRPCPRDRTLSDLLVSGEIDALYSARTPRPFAEGRPEVRRLFQEPRVVEEAYFRETGIFPIMHTVVLRRDVYERTPWLARSLVKAFGVAKTLALYGLEEANALRISLPWLADDVERVRNVLGSDYWPYGVEPNRHTLETFLRYSHEQGLAKRLLSVEELFAPQTLEETRI